MSIFKPRWHGLPRKSRLLSNGFPTTVPQRPGSVFHELSTIVVWRRLGRDRMRKLPAGISQQPAVDNFLIPVEAVFAAYSLHPRLRQYQKPRVSCPLSPQLCLQGNLQVIHNARSEESSVITCEKCCCRYRLNASHNLQALLLLRLYFFKLIGEPPVSWRCRHSSDSGKAAVEAAGLRPQT